MVRVHLAIGVLSTALLGIAHPQQVFRTKVDLVPIYATVIGRDGRTVRGLNAADFKITDGGKPRPIESFSADRRPFAMAVVIDSTTSMVLGAGRRRTSDFAQAFIAALDGDDYIAIGSLSRPLVSLTRDKAPSMRLFEMAPEALSRDFGARGAFQGELQTERGMDWATDELSAYDGRRIVMLLTDGRNPAMSETGADAEGYRLPAQTAGALINRADRSDVSVHVIAFDDTMVREEFLTAFASTGGGASLIARDAKLDSVCRELIEELHTEYLLGFTPTVFDGKSHKVQVKVNRPNVKVRARTTYWAPTK